jgi:hypothetical protein
MRTASKIGWYAPLVSAVLLAEQKVDRHFHPPVERLENEIVITNQFGCTCALRRCLLGSPTDFTPTSGLQKTVLKLMAKGS